MTNATRSWFHAAFVSAALVISPLAVAAEPDAVDEAVADDTAGSEDIDAPVAAAFAQSAAPAPAAATAATPAAVPVSYGTLLAGLGGAASDTSVLRFTNGSTTAGTVTLTLYDATTGTQTATWTSTSIASHAALQVTATQIVGAATPALTATQKTAVFNATAVATYRGGTVQQLTRTATSLSTLNTCGGGDIGPYGYFEGPGFTGLTGILRLVNGGTTAGTASFAIRDAATGTQLATWTSPSIPAKGYYNITATALAAAATPVVPATTVALSLVPTKFTAHIAAQHIANVTGTTAAADLGDACGLAGPPMTFFRR